MLAQKVPPRARQLVNAARGIEQPRVVRGLPAERVLVLAPHPDDEVIGCGGSIVAHRAAGCDVVVVHVTSGERTWSAAGSTNEARRADREDEARRAAGALGLDATTLRFWRREDGGLAADARLQGDLRALVDELTPDLVYAPWPNDAHSDHRALTAALAGAVRGRTGPLVALYEVWDPLVPTHIVDVTAHIEKKTAALASYESATAGIDYVRTASGLAAYRSGQGLGGRGYAEAFCVVAAGELDGLVAAP